MERDTSAEETPEECCMKCHFHVRHQSTYCRRYPPTLYTEIVLRRNPTAPNLAPQPSTQRLSSYIPVDPKGWCGEFKAETKVTLQ